MTYEEITNTVLNYYSQGSDIWQKVNAGTATPAEVYNAFSYVPQMEVVMSSDGQNVLSVGYRNTLTKMVPANANIVSNVDSNLPVAYDGGQNGVSALIPASAAAGGGGGGGEQNTTFSSGAKKPNGNTVAAVSDKLNLAITGASLGAKLGMKIDQALYNTNPDWWDEHYPAINPETWGSLVTTWGDPAKQWFCSLFGIDDNGNTTAYLDEMALAYTYQMLRENGAFNTGESSGSNEYYGTAQESSYFNHNYYNPPMNIAKTAAFRYNSSATNFHQWEFSINSGDAWLTLLVGNSSSPDRYYFIAVGDAEFTLNKVEITQNSSQTSTITSTRVASTHSANKTGHDFYYHMEMLRSYAYTVVTKEPLNIVSYSLSSIGIDNFSDIYNFTYGGTVTGGSGIDGITKDPDATIPDPAIINGNNPQDILQQLKTNYPDLFDDYIENPVLQNDGTIDNKKYVPVPLPNISSNNDPAPVTGTQTQPQTQVIPQSFVDLMTQTPPPTNPPDTGTGEALPFVAPSGSASSLWAIYNPTQAQLDSFGSWLWSSDFVDQLKKLFNDPMQAIIGVHKVYGPVTTGSTQTIKCGYLDSNVSSKIVTEQYSEVDCGSVDCSEYFGNVFDYDPHTKVSIYLPFIGVMPLKVSEVMRSTIHVTYGIDVITGACLAKVEILRDGGGAILYSYGGSCACHYPISSGSYASIISGVVTAAVGIAGGIATGNPLAAMGGALAGVHQMHTEVQRSGGFTGCAGIMGPKTPYLIIDRPQTRVADNIDAFAGIPSNSYTTIGECSGYIKALEAHVEIADAYDDELSEIQNIITTGIII